MKRIPIVALSFALLVPSGGPAYAIRGGGGRAGVGPRGGAAAVGPRGGAAAVGPHGSTAVRNPNTGVTTFHGAGGGAAAVGPGGRGAAVGPHGGAVVHGPAGTAAVGPHGGVAMSNRSYYAGGAHYYRPTWGSGQINVYQRNFVGYPGWRPYGAFYGLAAPLAVYSSLAFLSAGLLIGTYAAQPTVVVGAPPPPPKTIYVYVVNENGVQKEYRVDSAGHILSTRIVG